MDYNEALSIIHDSSRWRGPKRPLSRTKDLLRALGAPEEKMKFIHIAGTNGKGSTAAMLEAILRASGYKTGLFTSPFVTRFNERIRVNGRDIPDDDLAELVEKLLPVTDALSDAPTEFEIVTVLGLMYFARCRCEIVILEAGMGGESDFTNVIGVPETAVITNVGLDHMKQLGPTIRDIAGVKAGIIKPGGDAVIYGGAPEADEVFAARADLVGARLTKTPRWLVHIEKESLNTVTFSFGRYRHLTLPLAGSYQPWNAAVALTTVERLREKGWYIPYEAVVSGLTAMNWKGRFELAAQNPAFILDGAHNPQAVSATAESLKSKLEEEKIVFLIGVMADKDYRHMIPYLLPLAKRFVTIEAAYPRALSARALAEVIRELGGEAEAADSVTDGVRRAVCAAGEQGTVCSLGSIYLIEDVKRAVQDLLGQAEDCLQGESLRT